MTMTITEFFRARYDAGFSLSQILLERAMRNDEAMTFLGRDGDEDKLSYKDLLQQAWRLTQQLKQHGMRFGTPVIFAIDDEKHLVISLWAVLLGGGVAVPLTPPASYSAHDEAFKKIIAVYGQCKRSSREEKQKVMLLSDLNLEALSRHPEWQACISAETYFDIEDLLEACSQQVNAEILPLHHQLPKADALAILMFSSGSTGDPKGVRLTHRNLLANLIQLCERSEIEYSDRSLSWLPLTHDMGLVLFHLCHTLSGIAQYKMTPLSFARSPSILLAKTSDYKISLLGMPNFGFDQVLRAAQANPETRWDLSSVRLIYNGAEPIDPALCRRFIKHFEQYGISPHVISPAWGIAEAAVAASGFFTSQLQQYEGIPSLWISAHSGLHIGQPIRLAKAEEAGALELCALGYPMAGMRIRARDDDGEILDSSVLGHLEISGPNVTQGYFDSEDREWCSSGDIGFIHQGLVYLTGRAKDVIFLNGRNLYSNDIETNLCQQLDLPIGSVAVVGITDPQRRIEQIYAFFRHERGTDRDAFAEKLRQSLELQLSYPVRAVIGIAALPRTTSGKIKRFALRLALLNGDFNQDLECTRTLDQSSLQGRELEIAKLISQMLGLPNLVLDAELPLSRFGLDSVAYMQLGHRLQQEYDVSLNTVDLIRAKTLAGVSNLLESKLALHIAREHEISVLETNRVPLTARQKMLWAAWLLEPQGNSYHETYWIQVKGSIDHDAWLSAARSVIAKHPMLQTKVDDGDEPSLLYVPSKRIDLELIQCESSQTAQLMEQASQQAFDLRHTNLLRLKLYRDELHHSIWISAHHIITDGWSLHELLNQIFSVYAGGPVPSAHKTLWYEEAKFSDSNLALWSNKLKQAQAVLLPGHRSQYLRGPTGTRSINFSLFSSRALQQWRLQHGSEFAVITGALLILSARLANIGIPCIATVSSGRAHPNLQSQTAQQHGFFALSLPCAIDLSTLSTSSDLIRELEEYRLDLLSGTVPDLATLAVRGDHAITDKIRVVYVHQNTPAIDLPPHLQLETQGRFRGTARTDICISSSWKGERLVLEWDYDADSFLCEQIEAYAELLEHVLTQMLANPKAPLNTIDLLSLQQRRLCEAYLATSKNVDFMQSITTRFETGVKHFPQLPALSDGNEQFSYAELRVQIDHVCGQIEKAGIARGERIMLATSRNADYVIGLFACLKMACVAVPIDPALPIARMQQIADDSQTTLILTSAGLLLDATLTSAIQTQAISRIGKFGPQHQGRQARAEEHAYIIYTSGSTGKPKGVINTHRSLINMIDWVIDAFQYQIGESICQFAPFSFDVSLAEILPSLCAGLYLHILPDERRASPTLYLESMRENRINIATLTPAYLAVLNEQAQQCASSLTALRLLIVGGEALKTDEVRLFREHSPQVRIMNVYGPTETTVLSSAYAVPLSLHDGRQWQPLGYPIANTEFWVLDDELRPCPATVGGTLYIGGDGLSEGYWRDPQKTEQAFLMLSPDGGSPRRFYCSGDLARISIDGQLEFIGRADSQIKLRGFRIELNEISSVLEQHPLIQTAVVIAPVRNSGANVGQEGERALVAYYSGQALSHQQLTQFANDHLPAHMRPAMFIYIEQWPLNSNRKIDMKALPAPDWRAASSEASLEDRTPINIVEQQLLEIWTSLLKIEGITRHDNFALLGGSSLSAAQLVNRIREKMGRELPLIDILRHPILHEMAQCIANAPKTELQGPTRTAWDHRSHQIASEAQARMLFLERSTPGTALNNIPLTLAIHGDHGKALDFSQLQTAAQALFTRHPILRICLRVEAAGVVQAYPQTLAPEVGYFEAEHRQEALGYLEKFHAKPFDIDNGPLWRIALVKCSDQREWLALCMHHAIADGISLVRILKELELAYQGHALIPEPDELNYSDYVAWQNQLLGGAYGRQAEQYWASKVHRSPQLVLPTPSAPSLHSKVAGHQFVCDLNEAQTSKLKTLGKHYQISPFATMISLFGLVLGQTCDSHHFAIGITFSGRSHQAIENVPGLFVNTLPLSFEWAAKDSLSDLLQRTKTNVASLQALQDFPLNRAMAAMGQRELPFNILFNEEMLPASFNFAGLEAQLEGISTGIAKFPLLISFLFGAEQWRWRVEVRENECCRNWVDEFMQNVRRLVDQIDLDALNRLDELDIKDEELLALLTSK